MSELCALNILLIEDTDEDAELIQRELRKVFKAQLRRVWNEAGIRQTLAEFEAQIVLSDFSLGGFNGLMALDIVRQLKPDLPFIFVSGTIGEERAIESAKRGATDYVPKDNLKRLNVAIQRALQEAEDQRARFQFERELRESEERYFLALQGSRDGLWDWDAKTGKMHLSPRFKAILGIEQTLAFRADLEKWRSRIHPNDAAALLGALDQHLRGLSDYFEQELRIRHRNGSQLWVLARGVAVRDAEGNPIRMAGSLTDITERKLSEEMRLRDAFYDKLTGLPNRTRFLERTRQCLNKAAHKKSYGYCVLILNLDRFRYINDGLGYDAGDELLIDVARSLADLIELEPDATLARLEADEFGILLESLTTSNDPGWLAERIQGMMDATFFSNSEQSVRLSFSIGCVMGNSRYQRAEELLRDANAALLKAKSLGARSYHLFSPQTALKGSHVLKLETELRKALEDEELELHYQPIVSLIDGRILGSEALVRWRHPRMGMVLPGEFIALAEETGMILQLDEWALRQACAQTKAWNDQGFRLWVAVNISAMQFLKRDMRATVINTLERSGLDPHCLKIELTERTVMRDIEKAALILQELRDAGIQLSLDDFGTGYSSLSYLKRLPFNTLKLDRSFVTDLPHSPESQGIARTIINLGHTLRQAVTAEGVETYEQMRFLRESGCDDLQGWLFSKALPVYEFKQLLQNERRLNIINETKLSA